MARIGLISDTHGLLRPEAVDFLRGADHLIHAGDIGQPSILADLAALAPLTAVRGNNDRGPWAADLPEMDWVEIGGVLIQVIHDVAELRAQGPRPGVRVVVAGHSHVPAMTERAGVLYLNPGSAGPRRFRLPVSVAELRVEDGAVSARLVTLEVPAGKSG